VLKFVLTEEELDDSNKMSLYSFFFFKRWVRYCLTIAVTVTVVHPFCKKSKKKVSISKSCAAALRMTTIISSQGWPPRELRRWNHQDSRPNIFFPLWKNCEKLGFSTHGFPFIFRGQFLYNWKSMIASTAMLAGSLTFLGKWKGRNLFKSRVANY